MLLSTKRLLPVALLFAAALAAAWILANRLVTFEQIKAFAESAHALFAARPVLSVLALVLAHAVSMALSLPTKALLTLLSGAVAGPILAVPLTFAGVLAGTTALFFAVRHLFKESARARFGDRARALEARIERRPMLALAGLRLIVWLPYGPITIAAALTSVRYRDFALGSLLGDLPVVVLYCLAGERLAVLATASDALSPLTIAVLVAAGLVALIGALAGKTR